MQRTIYNVTAYVVDANGTYNTLTGYPKTFDSRNYNNDTTKAHQRAMGEFHACFAEMCNRDDRKMQMVMLMTADGRVMERQVLGAVPPEPDPEPETDE